MMRSTKTMKRAKNATKRKATRPSNATVARFMDHLLQSIPISTINILCRKKSIKV